MTNEANTDERAFMAEWIPIFSISVVLLFQRKQLQ